jgi:hypothetical protein
MKVDTFKSLLTSLLLPEWIYCELIPVIKQGDIRMDPISLMGNLKQIETLSQPETCKGSGLEPDLAQSGDAAP